MIAFLKRLFSRVNGNTEERKFKIDLKISDLEIGYILEYELKNWEVTDIMTYTWDNGVSEKEYTIHDGKTTLYLNYDASQDKASLYWKENLQNVWPLARQKMQRNERMLDDTFQFQGEDFHFASDGSAMLRNSVEKFEMVNWLFMSLDDQKMMSFNKYEDGSMEVYAGKVLPKFAINNILPRE